jgi:hypothetical protein
LLGRRAPLTANVDGVDGAVSALASAANRSRVT